MFRTRDFMLVAIVFLFLLILIAFTYSQNNQSKDVDPLDYQATVEIVSVSASVSNQKSNQLSRDERLALLQAKIEQSELVTISEPEETEVETDQSMQSTSTNLSSENSGPVLCTNYYQQTRLQWPVNDIRVEVVEGARLYFTETPVSPGTSSSTAVNKNILLTLPAQFIPFGETSCLPTDIVGVAIDGSLIRNNEVGLYGIFGNQTLIGYALDGFPIYGIGTSLTDQCGGRIELGKYRYELSSSRQTIINCFAGNPETIQ